MLRAVTRAFIALLILSMTSVAGAENDEEEQERQPSTYLELTPDFVVNIGEPDAGRNFLKAEVTLRFEGEERMERAQAHEPWLRHKMVMLLSGQPIDRVSSAEGQDELRGEALQRLNELLEEETGEPLVREVLFPSFITQTR